MTNISDIFDKYGAINTHQGTDKTTTHSYGKVYNKYFSSIRESTESVLEIGIDSGMALQAYSEFFINAQIYGIDIGDNVKQSVKDNRRVNLYFGDATNQDVVNHFNTEFDIIVEDASHKPEHQIQHFKDFNKFVKPGGYYIIEDVNGQYYSKVLEETKKIANNDFECIVHDLRREKNRFDDILIVFRKK